MMAELVLTEDQLDEVAGRMVLNAIVNGASSPHDLLLSRAELARRAGETHGGDRTMWDTLGYPIKIEFKDYLARVRRSDVAGAIVDVPAQATWRPGRGSQPPTVVEVGDESEDGGQFKQAFEELARRVRPWMFFERVDRTARIGHYGCLLIGDTRGGDLGAPLTGTSLDDIGYLAVYRQDHADIIQIDDDPASPRFGRPSVYELTLGTTLSKGTQSSRPLIDRSVRKTAVHWSRIIHVAEDPLEDEVFGRPALERVWNLLIALDKIGHGSAEMYWQNVAGIIHLDVPADVEVDPTSLQALSKKIHEALHGLRRMVETRSADLEIIGGGTPDPRGAFEVLSSLISAATRIPKRLLFGSEAGQLASSQDEANFLGRIAERQKTFAEPQIVRPFVDRLIEAGALPMAEYEVRWPSLFRLNDLEESEIMERRARSLRNIGEALLPGGRVLPVSDDEIRQKFLRLRGEAPSESEVGSIVRDDELAPDTGDDDAGEQEFGL